MINDFEISDETLKFLHEGSVSHAEPRVTSPMFTFKNDPDTGMCSKAANEVSFTITTNSGGTTWYIINGVDVGVVDDINDNLCADITMSFLSMKEKFFREKFDTKPNIELLISPSDLAIQQLMQ